MPYKRSINKKHPNFQELYDFEDIRIVSSYTKTHPTNNSGYYPIGLCGGDQYISIGNTGRLGVYDLSNTRETVCTLRYYYATQVWNTAIAIASRHTLDNPFLYILPHWEDRDDSFRRLVNNEKFTDEMLEKLWKLMEDIANSGNIKVHEGYFLLNETDESYGDHENKFHVILVIDAETAQKAEQGIKDVWSDDYNKKRKIL